MINERLLSLPEEIEQIKIKLMDKQQDLSMVKDQLKFWELSEMAQITNELDDKGKPKYSNDVKRNAELQHRKDTSEIYGDRERASKRLEREVAELNIKLDRLYNEQGNLRAICRLEGEASA